MLRKHNCKMLATLEDPDRCYFFIPSLSSAEDAQNERWSILARHRGVGGGGGGTVYTAYSNVEHFLVFDSFQRILSFVLLYHHNYFFELS